MNDILRDTEYSVVSTDHDPSDRRLAAAQYEVLSIATLYFEPIRSTT